MAMARTPRGVVGTMLALATVATMCMTLTAGSALGAAGGQRATEHHRLKDSDRDGMPNRWERRHGTRVHKRDAKADPDKDRLRNLAEFRHHTKPHRADTDHDGLKDGAEVHSFDTDPLKDDSDHDGIEDGKDDGDDDGIPDEGEDHDGDGFVGTITSFDPETGRLMFVSGLGWPVTALVTEDTRVRFVEGCWADHACGYLGEGQDIVELHFSETPVHGVPAIRWMLLACPPGD
jgi:hypothetical protein